MAEFGTELIIIAILIALNHVLAMIEAAFFAVRKARLQQKINEGDTKAAVALHLTENPNQVLSVIQIGITLIDVLTGALTGATLAIMIARGLDKYPALSPYSDSIGLTAGVLVITYFSIILGELVPKRLALQNPEGIASFFSGTMLFLSKALSPVVRFLSFSTDMVLRLLGIRPSDVPPVTEEEIHVMLDQGTQAGVFEEAEYDMVAGIFRLNDRRVYSLMTPRTEIVWLDVNSTEKDILNTINESSYSRFPVCQGGLDNPLGIVTARELLKRNLAGEKIKLKECLSPALFIPETNFASRALEIFKESENELILLIDEFGGVTGLLTITDILEEIVGDIETSEPQATQRQDGSWLLDGMLGIEEFKELFSYSTLPNENKYETLGGFVMAMLDRIPQVSDQFEWEGLRLEVMDMDGRRVDKVLVTTLPPLASQQENAK
ncbi:MAG: hemolysin family protein [Anaerolineales bacterium]